MTTTTAIFDRGGWRYRCPYCDVRNCRTPAPGAPVGSVLYSPLVGGCGHAVSLEPDRTDPATRRALAVRRRKPTKPKPPAPAPKPRPRQRRPWLKPELHDGFINDDGDVVLILPPDARPASVLHTWAEVRRHYDY